jgi:hypothetical protein
LVVRLSTRVTTPGAEVVALSTEIVVVVADPVAEIGAMAEIDEERFPPIAFVTRP